MFGHCRSLRREFFRNNEAADALGPKCFVTDRREILRFDGAGFERSIAQADGRQKCFGVYIRSITLSLIHI